MERNKTSSLLLSFADEWKIVGIAGLVSFRISQIDGSLYLFI